jgi:hypothetical protein
VPRVPEQCRLVHGPYRAPRLSVGDRTSCLLCDAEVIVTRWSAARISWPRSRAVDNRGGSSVLLDDELARAVRNESAEAVGHCWGVQLGVVWRWCMALGVTRTNNARTHRLMLEACLAGAEAVKAREWTDADLDAKSALARRLKLARHLHAGHHGPWWTAAQWKLLGNLQDAEGRAGVQGEGRRGHTMTEVGCLTGTTTRPVGNP